MNKTMIPPQSPTDISNPKILAFLQCFNELKESLQRTSRPGRGQDLTALPDPPHTNLILARNAELPTKIAWRRDLWSKLSIFRGGQVVRLKTL